MMGIDTFSHEMQKIGQTFVAATIREYASDEMLIDATKIHLATVRAPVTWAEVAHFWRSVPREWNRYAQ